MAGVWDLSKRILIVLSEFGYWGEELVGPLETFDEAGYEVDFATPKGKRPTPLPPSMDPQYIDPPLGQVGHLAGGRRQGQGARRLDPATTSRSTSRPGSRSARTTARRRCSRDQEAYYARLDEVEKELAKYDAILLVGGSGPIVDIANNDRIHALILLFQKLNKPIGAECYGVAALAFARDLSDRESIISGKRVTGHCKEYDYKDGTGFIGVMFNMGPPPYPLEYILRDATAPDGEYIGNVGHATSVIVDYPFITGRSTPDSYLTGEKMVEVLEKGLTRYGW